MPEEKVFPSDNDECFLEREIFPNFENFDKFEFFSKMESDENLGSSKKMALLEFRCRVEDSIMSNYIFNNSFKDSENVEKMGSKDDIDIKKENLIKNNNDLSIWGVPLLPSKGFDGTNVLLLRFLRARDFNVPEAFNLLKKTLSLRKEFEIEQICEEEEEFKFKNVVFIDGEDKEGRPICYNVFGEFNDKELYDSVFKSEEKRKEFLRWKVRIMEKGMMRLSFKPNEVDSVLQIIDMKNSPGIVLKELRSFCDNYPELIFRTILGDGFGLITDKYTDGLLLRELPELIFRTIFINVPVWYMLRYTLRSQFSSQGNKSKYVFARPSRVTQTLLEYVGIEKLPIQYGGLKRENDDEFSPDDKAISLIARGLSLQTIQVPILEAGVTVIWDMAVVGLEVTYKEEFIPDDDCSYNVLIQVKKKTRQSVRNSFYINEPGKIVITVDNGNSKNKKIFFRHKKKPTVPVYMSRPK